jgi:hypothetical protein
VCSSDLIHYNGDLYTTESIGRYSFSTTPLTNTHLKTVFLPTTIRLIQDGAFADCLNLQHVVTAFPSSLEHLNPVSFIASGILSFHCPATLISIESHALSWCISLSHLSFAPNSHLKRIGAFAFAHSPIIAAHLPAIDELKNAFDQCIQLFSFSIEQSSLIDLIPSRAFHGAAIREIVIPKNVAEVADFVFASCRGLEKVEFADDGVLESIGKKAFWDTGVMELVIPRSVRVLKKECFAHCPNLCCVTFAERSQLRIVEKGVFRRTMLMEVIVPEGAIIEEPVFTVF